jgi:hypothetical protein
MSEPAKIMAIDVPVGAALTANDYYGWNPVTNKEMLEGAPTQERLGNLAANVMSSMGVRYGIQKKNMGLGGLGLVGAAGSAPGLRVLRTGTESFENAIADARRTGGQLAELKHNLLGSDREVILPGGDKLQPSTGQLPSALKTLDNLSTTLNDKVPLITDGLNRVVTQADTLVSSAGNAANQVVDVSRPYVYSGGGALLGGLLGQLMTEPLTGEDSRVESEGKQYRNRLKRVLGAILGGSGGLLAHHFTKKSSAEDVATRVAYPLLAAAAGTGIGYAGSGLSEYLEPSSSDKERRKRRNHLMLSGAGSGLGVGLSQLLKEYLTKRANEKAANAGYGGYQGMAFQQNLPVSQRRQLTDAEKADVADGQTKWLRGPFASEGDSISRRMASPTKRSLLTALATTAAGAGLGAYGASQSGGSALGGAVAGGGLGALGGIPMGILAYMEQQKLNKTLEERMRRLPEGNTTLRDMMSDPVTGYGERMNSFQQQMNPAFSGSQLAEIAAMAARVPQRQQYKFAEEKQGMAIARGLASAGKGISGLAKGFGGAGRGAGSAMGKVKPPPLPSPRPAVTPPPLPAQKPIPSKAPFSARDFMRGGVTGAATGGLAAAGGIAAGSMQRNSNSPPSLPRVTGEGGQMPSFIQDLATRPSWFERSGLVPAGTRDFLQKQMDGGQYTGPQMQANLMKMLTSSPGNPLSLDKLRALGSQWQQSGFGSMPSAMGLSSTRPAPPVPPSRGPIVGSKPLNSLGQPYTDDQLHLNDQIQRFMQQLGGQGQ